MVFSKKMLGSCCVGLALLLSGESFGSEKAYIVGTGQTKAKISIADVENGVKAFQKIENWEAKKAGLESYWGAYVAAYVIAKKGVAVGGATERMTPEQILGLSDWELSSEVCDLPGGEDLYLDILMGVFSEDKSSFSGGSTGVSDVNGSGEDWGSSVITKGGVKTGDEDDAVFDRNIKAAQYLTELKTALKAAGKEVKEFNLGELQQAILKGEQDQELKDIVSDSFDVAYHLFAYFNAFYREKVLPVPASLEKLRDKYFTLMTEVADKNKKAKELTNKLNAAKIENAGLKNAQSQLKTGGYTVTVPTVRGLSNDVVIQGAFKAKPEELNGIAKVDRGTVSGVVEATKVGFYNKDNYDVFDKATEAKYAKADHEVIDTTTHIKVEKKYEEAVAQLAEDGHEVVNTAQKAAVSVREKMLAKVEGLKESSYFVTMINSSITTRAAVFGNGTGVQAAARNEVDKVMGEVAKIKPVFDAIDTSTLKADDIAVLNAIAEKILTGNWSDINDNTDGVADEGLKRILDTAKTLIADNVKDAEVANLVTAELGRSPGAAAPTANDVRKYLLIAALADKTAQNIKDSIDD